MNIFVDTRECLVELQVAPIREMKEKLGEEKWIMVEKKLRYMAHKNMGLETFDSMWNSNLDYKEHFQKVRQELQKLVDKHNEHERKLKEEKQILKGQEGGGDEEDDEEYIPSSSIPGEYKPQKFWGDTQVYFDEEDKQRQQQQQSKQ